jgi:hypothetical protein
VDICEACLEGKQHRLAFKNGNAWKEKAVLRLVQANICDLMRIILVSSARYFLFQVDKFSRNPMRIFS